MECVWNLHTPKTSGIQIRFKSFKLQDTENTDLLTVYDGPDSSSRLIYTYHGLNTPPLVIESTSSDLTIVFYSDSFVKEKGFNFTYQNKGTVQYFGRQHQQFHIIQIYMIYFSLSL